MINWINSFSTIGHLPTDSTEIKIEKSFLVFLACFMSGGGVLWGTISIAHGLVLQSTIPYGYIVISVINMTYFKYSKNFRVVRFVQILNSLVLPFLFQWSLGGFFPSGIIMLWAILALVASLSFNDLKSSFIWLVLYLTGTIVSGYFDDYFLARKPVILEDQSVMFTVLNVAVISTIFFGLVLYFVLGNRKDRAKLALATQELEKLNTELQKNLEEKQGIIHDLKKTQTKLIESEKMASLGVLSAGVGHEINNPLNYIKGGVHSLQKSLDKSDEQTQTIIDIINDGVDRAAQIVRSLSHFSRSGHKMDEKCEVHEVIENCLVILHNKLKHKVEVIRDFAESPIIILGNDGRLHQAFLNILSNAEQAISEKGVIQIKTQNRTGEVIVTIDDDGSGISNSNLAKIMDPFFTTKAPGKGTGLGLSITYRIIEEHNGSITVTSTQDKGTTFEVRLPAQKEG